MRGSTKGLLALLLMGSAAGCDLTDATIADFTDIFVAEVYVTVGDVPADNRLRAFLHGSSNGGEPGSESFDDADVVVTLDDGSTMVLTLAALQECVAERPEDSTGSCFAADAVQATAFGARDSLSIEVSLPGRARLTGATRVPGAFTVNGVSATCRVAPDARLPLQWSRSAGASSYVSETLILGLDDALAGEGIEAEDSLYLLGLSISESDTTVSFPNEFGVFDRFDLDRDVAVRLQEGIPEGVSAEVAITAVDDNYVNWVRGGNFNPSGAVRVSSLDGGGSGVFGSAVTRVFTIVSTTDTTAAPACGG
ncbi:MAG: hypothetical protein PVF90_10480 [Gemmatimonadota bacterium]|jgi:hypothetical protein